MVKRFKKVVTSLLAMSVVASSWSLAAFADETKVDCAEFDVASWYESAPAVDSKAAFGRTTPTPTQAPVTATVQLTEADIQAMNNNEAIIVYNDEGYVSTIVGRVYDTPVHTQRELRLVVDQLRTLLGLDEDYEIEPLVMDTYNNSITFTFRQYEDGFEVANSTLKILIDEDHYPAMIQSSLVPHLQTDYSGTEITSDEAEDVVSALAMGQGVTLSIFSDYTSQCVLNDAQIPATRCYRIYTDNPFASEGADMPYLIHYVDFDGNYLKNYPTNNLNEEPLNEYDNDAYFESLTATDYTFTVNRNGEDVTFTVPVSHSSRDGKYYLADPSRKIILADFYDFIYRGHLSFETSTNASTWDDNHLITYYNYIQAYDYYKYEHQYFSTDGFGIPILILTSWCDSNRNPVNNQCSMGTINGWSAFGSSDANTYGYSLDVIAHEYTHAVSGFLRQGNLYYNEYGAINEGFSDIMGNLCEMSVGDTDDTLWELGETSGNTVRSMSDPTLYGQPLAVGDQYYSNTIALPNSAASDVSDKGGVHSNDSLLSHLCYVLYEEGMSLDELGDLFHQAIILHTPKADYDDIYAALVASAQIWGQDEYIPVITQYFEDAGMFGDRHETVRSTAAVGYSRINLTSVNPSEAAVSSILLMQDLDTNETYYSAAMEDGTFSLCVPANGNYVIVVRVFTDPSFSELAVDYFYSAGRSGTGTWTTNQRDTTVEVPASGDIINLPALTIS